MSQFKLENIKEDTGIDLDELYPDGSRSDVELVHHFKEILQELYNNDMAIHGYHQIILYCIDHSKLYMAKRFYDKMIEPVMIEEGHPYSVIPETNEEVKSNELMPLGPKTSAFVYYCCDKKKVPALLWLIHNDMFDHNDIPTDLISKTLVDALIPASSTK